MCRLYQANVQKADAQKCVGRPRLQNFQRNRPTIVLHPQEEGMQIPIIECSLSAMHAAGVDVVRHSSPGEVGREQDIDEPLGPGVGVCGRPLRGLLSSCGLRGRSARAQFRQGEGRVAVCAQQHQPRADEVGPHHPKRCEHTEKREGFGVSQIVRMKCGHSHLLSSASVGHCSDAHARPTRAR